MQHVGRCKIGTGIKVDVSLRWNALRISTCVIRMRRCYIIGQEQRCSLQFVLSVFYFIFIFSFERSRWT